LIALNPDILVASAPSAAIAFKGVAPTLPIVCLGLTDAGIPASLRELCAARGQRDRDGAKRRGRNR
jgi:hypothetical protein